MRKHPYSPVWLMFFALVAIGTLPACTNPLGPILWDMDPDAAHPGEPVLIRATGWYVGFYGSTIDFNGAAVYDPGFPWSAWEPVEGPLARLGFLQITVDVPEGAQSGCVTLTETYLNVPSPCYPFTVLD